MFAVKSNLIHSIVLFSKIEPLFLYTSSKLHAQNITHAVNSYKIKAKENVNTIFVAL